MSDTVDALMEPRYAAAYAAMAAFQDEQQARDHLISGYPLEEQFRIDLVLWTIERLCRAGRAVDAAWLMHELVFFRANGSLWDADMDAFVRRVILSALPFRLWLDTDPAHHAWRAVARITGMVVTLLESVE